MHTSGTICHNIFKYPGIYEKSLESTLQKIYPNIASKLINKNETAIFN